jgi:preflagellin peptidase FlaK
LLVSTAVSIGLVVPLSYGFWLIGGFGGADAKAFFVIAVLFPFYPDYDLFVLGIEWLPTQLPVIRTTLGVFSLTILSNTVLAGVAYPLALGVRNAVAGHRSPSMFVAKPVRTDRITGEYGTLLRPPDRSLRESLSPSGLRALFSYRGLDLDALRMYLQYRGLTLNEIRADPARYRDPASLPEEPNDPGGGVVTDGGASGGDGEDGGGAAPPTGGDYDDPWGAEAFLSDIEGDAYGTTPADLREGLDALVEERTVWISPGIPFLVPLFAGLLVSLTVGDVLFALLGLAGLV